MTRCSGANGEGFHRCALHFMNNCSPKNLSKWMPLFLFYCACVLSTGRNSKRSAV
jgi:hypothetical protein